jgi:hypothetical protein
MRYLFIILIVIAIPGNAQNKIVGYIFDAQQHVPLLNASVFLNNTSIGTQTNDKGYFELIVPAGKFELIVSSVGYQTYQQVIIAPTNLPLSIILHQKIETLDEVVVVSDAYEKDGWKKWGKWFYEQFVGTSSFGKRCKIKNPEVIRFRISPNKQLMTVIAKAPLIIENKALGYNIRYQLEVFQYEFVKQRLFYAGFPFFEQMKGGTRQLQRWKRNRADAYDGSALHFMRSLYIDQLTEAGYDMRYLFKYRNEEKERVKQVYKKRILTQGNVIDLGGDSSAYYQRILQQPDVRTETGKNLLTRDSIGFMNDSSAFVFNNKQYIQVYYKNKPVPIAYQALYPKSNAIWLSELVLINQQPIELYQNGAYYSPTELMLIGFWAWWEKIGTLLPVDYNSIHTNVP